MTMSDTEVAEILKLPVEERLRLVELICQRLSAMPSALPLSDAHRAAINKELANHRREPNDVITIEQVLARVRRTE